MIAATTDRPPAPVSPPAGPAPGAHAQRLRAVAVSRETTSALTIVTDDGDRVTLSTRTALAAGAATYDLRGPATLLHAEAARRALSREVGVSIEGELSREEWKDIRRLVKGLRQITRELLAGDLEDAAARATRLGKRLDSLAGFDYAFTQRQAIVTADVAAAGPPAGAEPAPAA
jgi:hypothetical protein